MALGLGRAAALAVGACALIAVAWLPPSSTVSERTRRLRLAQQFDNAVPQVTRDVYRVSRELALANEALEFLERRDSLAGALGRQPDTPTGVAAPNVPQAWRRWLAEQTEHLTASVVHESPAAPVLSAVFLDTVNWRDRPRERRRWDVWFNTTVIAFDSAATPFSCVAMHDIRRMARSRDHFAVMDPDRFPSRTAFGVCRFFAAYGRPGHGIAAWLRNGGWQFGTASGAETTDAFQLRYVREGLSLFSWTERFYALDACVEGAARGCREWVLAPNAPSSAQLNGLDAYVSYWSDQLFGGLLSDLDQEMGPERMRAFWTSPLPTDSAFQSAFGVDLGTWVLGWLDRWYGPLGYQGPRPRDYGTTLLLAAALVAFGAAKAYGRNVTAS